MLVLLLIGACFTFFADDKNKNSDAKTKITAEHFSYKISEGEAVYSGDVVVLDPQIDIFTDKMTVFFAKGKHKRKDKPKPAINPSEVGKKGGGKTNKPKAALAPLGGIGGNIDRIICEGNVIIVNKKDQATATGDRAVYTATNELMVITGNAKLRTKDGVLYGKIIEYNRLTGDLTARQAVLINEGKPKKVPEPKDPKGK
jgi:lipopolysaccharide export system protein LptA